jgi:hypothetical protein
MSKDFTICKPYECRIIAELEQELEARIGEYQKISAKAGAMGNDFVAVAHGHYAIEAQSLLSLIQSKRLK